MKKLFIYTLALGLLHAGNSFGQTIGANSKVEKGGDERSLEIINKFLHIIFIENNKGAGLSDLLDRDFVFDNPFSTARGANDFITKVQMFISTKKTYKIERQFVNGDAVCSVYSFDVVTTSASTENFEVTAYAELRNGKIVKEREYFSDPLRFAKAMGFLDNYLKAYQ
ncbi:nuclear transport factor 2 family protein [Dyadobacter arcticus]|uniref:Limonene-1,2-epoxide hydrolase n=1 Tax=Dyadobacter arcticus TaxID=1078754 RepID=A0ABX0UV59_9BACT|nr:nuclear transport factor 2 family protein [Dyadobacter arcticus]NIJ56129.1 limonene-1,2-epoxide hydrolase [Dyadobacter arcticus]